MIWWKQSISIILYVRIVDHLERFNIMEMPDNFEIGQNFVENYGTHYLSEKVVGKELQVIFNFKNLTREEFRTINNNTKSIIILFFKLNFQSSLLFFLFLLYLK